MHVGVIWGLGFRFRVSEMRGTLSGVPILRESYYFLGGGGFIFGVPYFRKPPCRMKGYCSD